MTGWGPNLAQNPVSDSFMLILHVPEVDDVAAGVPFASTEEVQEFELHGMKLCGGHLDKLEALRILMGSRKGGRDIGNL